MKIEINNQRYLKIKKHELWGGRILTYILIFIWCLITALAKEGRK